MSNSGNALRHAKARRSRRAKKSWLNSSRCRENRRATICDFGLKIALPKPRSLKSFSVITSPGCGSPNIFCTSAP